MPACETLRPRGTSCHCECDSALGPGVPSGDHQPGVVLGTPTQSVTLKLPHPTAEQLWALNVYISALIGVPPQSHLPEDF